MLASEQYGAQVESQLRSSCSVVPRRSQKAFPHLQALPSALKSFQIRDGHKTCQVGCPYDGINSSLAALVDFIWNSLSLVFVFPTLNVVISLRCRARTFLWSDRLLRQIRMWRQSQWHRGSLYLHHVFFFRRVHGSEYGSLSLVLVLPFGVLF